MRGRVRDQQKTRRYVKHKNTYNTYNSKKDSLIREEFWRNGSERELRKRKGLCIPPSLPGFFPDFGVFCFLGGL